MPDRTEITAEPGALAPLLAELIDAHRELRYRWAASVTKPNTRVLDAGCATGEGTALLAATGASVVAVDRDVLIEIARTRVPDSVEVRAGSLDDLPADDDSFDVVVCVDGFDTGDELDPKAVLDELLRVLAADGLLVIAPTAPRDDVDEDVFDAADLVELLSAAGFEVATFAQDTWLYASMHAGTIPLMVDNAGPIAQPSLVIASKASLPQPAALVGAVTDLGVTRLRELQRDVRIELARAHEAVSRSERQREEVAEVEARLAAAEQELASMLDLEATLAETIAARDAAQAELAAVRSSMIWRVSAPLRWLTTRR